MDRMQRTFADPLDLTLADALDAYAQGNAGKARGVEVTFEGLASGLNPDMRLSLVTARTRVVNRLEQGCDRVVDAKSEGCKKVAKAKALFMEIQHAARSHNISPTRPFKVSVLLKKIRKALADYSAAFNDPYESMHIETDND